MSTAVWLGSGIENVASGFRIADFISQTNDFSAGDVVRYNFSTETYVRSRANTADNATWLGVVESATTEAFTIVYAGRIDLVLPVGWYFLSSTTAGLLTLTEPPSPALSAPVLVATANHSVVMPRRPSVSSISSTNLFGTSLFISGTIGVAATSTNLNVTLGTYYALFVDATTGTKTITLPALTGIGGRVYVVSKVDESSNVVQVVPPSGTISGFSAVKLLSQAESVRLIADETSNTWRLL